MVNQAMLLDISYFYLFSYLFSFLSLFLFFSFWFVSTPLSYETRPVHSLKKNSISDTCCTRHTAFNHSNNTRNMHINSCYVGYSTFMLILLAAFLYNSNYFVLIDILLFFSYKILQIYLYIF